MYVDIYPRTATGSGWANPSSILVDDSNYATVSLNWPTQTSYVSDVLYGYNFDTSSIPDNVIITGFQVMVGGHSSRIAPGTNLLASFSVDSNFDNVQGMNNYTFSDPLFLDTSDTIVTFGTSGEVLNSWNYIPTVEQIKNPYFAILVLAELSIPGITHSADFFLNSVQVRVWYSQPGYLVGTRSKFSHVNPAIDSIAPISNGVGLDYQIQSEQLNLIGDALYNIEEAVIWRHINPVLAVDGSIAHPQQYFFSVTVTGHVNTWVDGVVYEKGNIYGSHSNLSNTNLINSSRVKQPLVPDYMRCRFVSGIAWVETATGNVGCFVSPANFVVDPSLIGTNYWLSFSVYGSDVITDTTDVTVTSNLNVPTPYTGSHIQMQPVPPGNLFVKLFAVGVPGV